MINKVDGRAPGCSSNRASRQLCAANFCATGASGRLPIRSRNVDQGAEQTLERRDVGGDPSRTAVSRARARSAPANTDRWSDPPRAFGLLGELGEIRVERVVVELSAVPPKLEPPPSPRGPSHGSSSQEVRVHRRWPRVQSFRGISTLRRYINRRTAMTRKDGRDQRYGNQKCPTRRAGGDHGHDQGPVRAPLGALRPGRMAGLRGVARVDHETAELGLDSKTKGVGHGVLQRFWITIPYFRLKVIGISRYGCSRPSGGRWCKRAPSLGGVHRRGSRELGECRLTIHGRPSRFGWSGIARSFT